jgi:hypothetical protein
MMRNDMKRSTKTIVAATAIAVAGSVALAGTIRTAS